MIWNSPSGLMPNSKRMRSPFFNAGGTIPFGARNGMVIAPMPALGMAPCLMSRSPAPALTISPTAWCVCFAVAFGEPLADFALAAGLEAELDLPRPEFAFALGHDDDAALAGAYDRLRRQDRKSTRLNSSH